MFSFSVNVGDYIQAVLDRNLAENISRVLYPNDNVSFFFFFFVCYKLLFCSFMKLTFLGAVVF